MWSPPLIGCASQTPGDIYDWLGFEAYDLVFRFLDGRSGPNHLLDVLAYDFNSPTFWPGWESWAPGCGLSMIPGPPVMGAPAESASARLGDRQVRPA
jgi:hypothetical protein